MNDKDKRGRRVYTGEFKKGKLTLESKDDKTGGRHQAHAEHPQRGHAAELWSPRSRRAAAARSRPSTKPSATRKASRFAGGGGEEARVHRHRRHRARMTVQLHGQDLLRLLLRLPRRVQREPEEVRRRLREEQEMTTREAMWVGLKLLGLYFFVIAATQGAAGCHDLYCYFSVGNLPFTSHFINSAISHFIQAGVSLVAGVLFFCCTGMIVARPDPRIFHVMWTTAAPKARKDSPGFARTSESTAVERAVFYGFADACSRQGADRPAMRRFKKLIERSGMQKECGAHQYMRSPARPGAAAPTSARSRVPEGSGHARTDQVRPLRFSTKVVGTRMCLLLSEYSQFHCIPSALRLG